MAIILKPQVEMMVVDTFKPPAKPVSEAKVIEGFKPPPRVSYDSISDIQGEEKVVATKSIRVGKLNSSNEADGITVPVVETGLPVEIDRFKPIKKTPTTVDRFKPKDTVIESVVEQQVATKQALSFSQLRNVIEKQTVAAANSTSGLIKPKYIKDKSVFYKHSGYLKDLLGEK